MKNNFFNFKLQGSSNNQRGFFITLDAFISLGVVLIAIIIGYFYLSQITANSWERVDLLNITLDESLVLEKSSALSQAIEQESSEIIISSLDKTPYSYCFEVAIYSQSELSVPEIYALKKGCSKSVDEFISINRSLVVYNPSASFYIVKVAGWKK